MSYSLNVLAELRDLIRDDIRRNGKKLYQPNINRLIINNKPTKKLIAFNRRMINEDKTISYILPDKIYKKKTGELKRNIKKNNKFIKNPKIDSKKLLGDTILKQNNPLKNRTKKSYFDKVKKDIEIELKKKKKFSYNIDLTKTNFRTILKYLYEIKNKNKNFLPLGLSPSGEIIGFSDSNLKKLKNYDLLESNEGRDRAGSDLDFIFDAIKTKNFRIDFFKRRTDTNTRNNGAFFKYYHNLKNMNFDKYAIYNSKPKNYNDNCLYIALKQGGLEENKLNKLKSLMLDTMNMPLSRFNQIANTLDIYITVKKLKKCQIKSEILHYGISTNPEYKICLIDEHYFIWDDTNITYYALNNYEDIKDVEDYNKIYKKISNKDKSKSLYKKNNNRFVDSFTLVSLLLKNKDKLLRFISMDDIAASPYYNKFIDNDNLEYNEKTDLKVNEYKEKENNYYTIFFDFETITAAEVHIPYLCCSITEDGEEMSFIENNAKKFIEYLKNKFIDNDYDDKGILQNVLLIAHNLRYDFTFIQKYLSNIQPVLKGNSLMGGNALIYCGKCEKTGISKYIKLTFQDSNALIPMKLEKFGETFKLEQAKELLPYDIYTKENVEKRYIKLEECFKSVHIDTKEKKQLFLDNIKKWNLKYGNKIDIIEYSRRYCEIDCKVLKDGYLKYREWIREITGIDIKNYCSIASVGLDYLIKEGCFKGCYSLAGTPQQFIQQFVVGGRCMTADNKKWKISNKKLSDVDAISLYPSSMYRMNGFLKGKPKIINNYQKNFKFLNNQSGYFVKVKCLNNPTKNLDFPLLSYKNDKGIRDFSNETKDKIFYLDKTTYEDCKEFQGLNFKVICGYYYNEGYNDKINSVIKHLFTKRKEMKKIGNPIQTVYKQLMNSCYGKCLLKPIEHNIKIVKESEWEKYLSRSYNFIKTAIKSDNIYIVKEQKCINEHFNNVYAGVEILSMSKRIMNEVMVLAENNNMKIFYQDTDSMHLFEKDVEILSDLFKKKYNKELIGDDMGQFHVDFELKNCKDICATSSIFLAKKIYIDELQGFDKDTGKLKKDYHIRMKGVSKSAILNYTENNKNIKPMKIYEKLYNNKTLKFNLLSDKKAVKFKYTKDWNVCSLSEFNRKIKINNIKGVY